MATIQGPTRRKYWSNKPKFRFKGAPCRLGNLMSRNWFEAFLYSLRYTNINRLIFWDPLHKVCQMIMAWNSNMLKVLFCCGFLVSTSPCRIGQTDILALASWLFQESHAPLELSGIPLVVLSVYGIELIGRQGPSSPNGCKRIWQPWWENSLTFDPAH